MRRFNVVLLTLVILTLLWTPTAVWAQGESPLSLYTRFPAQVIEAGKTVTIDLTVSNAGDKPLIVHLDTQNLPEGWNATFRGLGRIVKAVYVRPKDDASVSLRLEQPADVQPDTYRIIVVATADTYKAELPLELTVQEKLPPRLKMEVELPILRGTPNTNFRFEATLRNEGDQDLTVNLEAQAPEGFQVVFKPSFGAQEVTSLPIKANESKRLNIEVKVPRQTPAGRYPIHVRAVGGGAEAAVDLAVELTGLPELSVTAPDGRLTANAYVGKETPLEIIIQNLGTANARNIELSATKPTGWKVEFDPKHIDDLPPGQQIKVTAKIRPSDKAIAGDYMVTIRASADGGVFDSTDFRITVLTSTMWGVVGIALIAVAVLIVALAVMRFGRR
ncbi:MAG: ABC transporter substrate-binding protein [Chloroflexi bacterium]|nr:ABC transporter substrate-binding protein [Chloroflexota bacterium]